VGKLADEIIKQAGDQLGITELTGRNDGPAVEMFLRSVGLGKGYPWCMAFVYWCCKQAAAKLGLKNPLKQTGGVLDEWESKYGEHIQSPEPGAIFILKHNEGYHTGICTSDLLRGDVFHTIEGNTNANGSREGTSVLRKVRSVDGIVGFIRLVDIPLTNDNELKQ
jgi:hypothetical protein